MNDAAPPRRIWLCADDYGLAEGVNRAIRDLISRGRLNATSVMVVGPAIGRDEVARIAGCRGSEPALRHRPARDTDGAVPPAVDALSAAPWRTVPAVSGHAAIGPAAAARSWLDRGRTAGATRGLQGAVRPRARFRRRPPARAAVSAGARRIPGRGEGGGARRLGAPGRQKCGRWPSGSVHPRRWCSMCSARNSAGAPTAAGIAFNPAFAGAYDFTASPDFGELMRQFIDGYAGRRSRDVPPGFRRRHTQKSRSPHHPARGRTRLACRRSVSAAAGGE